MNIRCRLFGCWISDEPEDHGCCGRCGIWVYDADFRQAGVPLVEWWRSVRSKWKRRSNYRHHLCGVCNKPMYLTEESCCSSECYDKWFPF